jgi:hypothetical protein
MKYGADGCAAVAWLMKASASWSFGLRSTCFSRSNKLVSNSRWCGVDGKLLPISGRTHGLTVGYTALRRVYSPGSATGDAGAPLTPSHAGCLTGRRSYPRNQRSRRVLFRLDPG